MGREPIPADGRMYPPASTDAARRALPHLPVLLIASDGTTPIHPPEGVDAGVLLRGTDLPTIVEWARTATCPLAVDIDSVRGLEADDSAAEWVVCDLGIDIVLTRRPRVAGHVASIGGLGIVHALAFDSTGLGRLLDGHPRRPGVGTVVSPGLVLVHMNPEELARLPRPVVAYGLIADPLDAIACLEIADGIVLRPEAAAAFAAATFAAASDRLWQSVRNPLTTG